MPYAIKKRGAKYCVDNTETGEEKGCSETRGMAVKHMAALYANEKKSTKETSDLILKAVSDFSSETGEEFTPDELDLKSYDGEYGEDSYFYPWSAKSYAEVEAQREELRKARKIQEAVHLFPTLANNILGSVEMSQDEKIAGLKALNDELISVVAEIGEEEDSDEDSDELKAVSKREDVSESDKKRAVSEYGNVRYADAKNKKYPVDTPAHIRAAWNYINMPRNAKKYSPAEVSQIKRKIVSAWKSKIGKEGPPSAEKMRKDLGLLTEHIGYYIKSIAGREEEAESDLLIFKDDGGRYRWIARYSNNFEDTDRDIISAESHRRYVEMVEKGAYPYPVIEVWHEDNWKFGKADWLAYDDSGFALASGTIDKGCEPIAEALMQLKSVANSHGMPKRTIVRDEHDQRVIKEHQTVEISVLPESYAANPITSSFFIKESTEEDVDMIPKDKKKEALQAWGVSETLLADLEALNAKEAKDATEQGIESKEADTPVDTPVDNAPADPPTDTETTPEDTTGKSTDAGVEAESESPLTRTEVAEAITAVLTPFIESIKGLNAKLDEMGGEIKSLKEANGKTEESVAEIKQDFTLKGVNPLASLIGNLNSMRAVGSAETEVNDLDPLLKEGPKETDPGSQVTGIPFLDQMLASPKK